LAGHVRRRQLAGRCDFQVASGPAGKGEGIEGSQVEVVLDVHGRIFVDFLTDCLVCSRYPGFLVRGVLRQTKQILPGEPVPLTSSTGKPLLA
jgi:hypothetical protein